jgi:hypothetical protein
VVTGTAIDIMDYHMSGGSNWITAPAALYSMLLVMGDRQAQTGGKLTSQFDSLWGAGRLRTRWLSKFGLDAPWYWYHGFACISQNEVWDFQPFGTASLPFDVDAVKAAAYWYDYRHDTAGTIANVNLFLRGSGGTLRSDTNAYDNKAFVFHANWPTEPLTLRLHGLDVTGHHDPACGGTTPNNMEVYFAIFAEDSGRNSPTYNPVNGTGIYPEDI